MASLNLSQDELRSLESARQRLGTLVASITSMRDSIVQINPLPPPSSLEASSFILQKHIESFLDVTSQNANLFQRIVVHPSNNFPGRQHGSILLQLLRKKLEPDVETSVEAAREAAIAAGIGPHSFTSSTDGPGGGGKNKYGASGGRSQRQKSHFRGGYGGDDDDDDDEDDDDDDEEGYCGPDEDDEFVDDLGGPREPQGLGDVWHESREWLLRRVTKFVREEEPDPYTRQERALGVESVRTGLRRNHEDDEEEDDEDDEDEDEEMEDVERAQQQQQQQLLQQQQKAPTQPTPPAFDPEIMLYFASRGDVDLPDSVERLSRPRPKKDVAGGARR